MTTVQPAHLAALFPILHARDSDRTTVQTSLGLLTQLVRESRYVVNERAVAEAILTRSPLSRLAPTD